MLGVSTRGYEASLEQPLERVPYRGTSTLAASRHLVTATRKKLDDDLSRPLGEEVDVVTVLVDGIELAEHTLGVSLGITSDGRRPHSGMRLGSTENERLSTEMLQDLLERGLRVEGQLLCVVDGGKGIRKALVDVLGEMALIQRCQVHKLRKTEVAPAEGAARLRRADDVRRLQELKRRPRPQASPRGARGVARAQPLR